MAGVAVVGHLTVDITPQLPGPPVLRPGVLAQVGPAAVALGGAVGNTGRVLAVLGVPVVGTAAIGGDDFGRIVIDRFAGLAGFEFRPQLCDRATGYTIVVEPPATDRTFWHHPGANAALRLDEVGLDGLDLVHFGYPSLMPGVCADQGAGLAGFLARAAGAGLVTSLDLAWVDPRSEAAAVDWPAFLRAALPSVDVLTPSYDDLASPLGLDASWDPSRGRALVEELLGWGAGVVMLSAGEHGVLLGVAGRDRLGRLARYGGDLSAWAGARLALPPAPVRRVATTVGAGDAATAGLLAALRRGRGPQDALRFATQVAAAVIEQGGTGAFTGLPA